MNKKYFYFIFLTFTFIVFGFVNIQEILAEKENVSSVTINKQMELNTGEEKSNIPISKVSFAYWQIDQNEILTTTNLITYGQAKQFFKQEPDGITEVTDDDGRVTFNLIPGTYFFIEKDFDQKKATGIPIKPTIIEVKTADKMDVSIVSDLSQENYWSISSDINQLVDFKEKSVNWLLEIENSMEVIKNESEDIMFLVQKNNHSIVNGETVKSELKKTDLKSMLLNLSFKLNETESLKQTDNNLQIFLKMKQVEVATITSFFGVRTDTQQNIEDRKK